MKFLLLSVLLTGPALLAGAGEPTVPHLSARSWRVVPGDAVEVVLPEHAASETAWFFVRCAGTQENRDSVRPDSDGLVKLVVPQTDCCLVGLDRKPRIESIDASALDSFFRRHVGGRPDGFDPGDGTPLRVRRIESMKMLVRVGPEDASPIPSATAQSKTGQTVELRPLADPTAVPIGAVLPLKVYGVFDTAGRTVVARHVARDVKHVATTDPAGIAAVTIDAAGTWQVEVHDARRPDESDDFEWEIRSATLTFDVSAATTTTTANDPTETLKQTKQTEKEGGR